MDADGAMIYATDEISHSDYLYLANPSAAERCRSQVSAFFSYDPGGNCLTSAHLLLLGFRTG